MELGLKNKVAFIAASSMGLGKSVALELAREGASVIICSRNKANLEKTKQEIENQTKADVLSVTGDLSIATERDRIINAVLQIHEKVDILVTNTGGAPSGKFETLTLQDWDQAYHQLLASAVGLINGFLPGMKKTGLGTDNFHHFYCYKTTHQ